MQKEIAQWQKYERLVAQLISNQLCTSYCVTANATLKGLVSGRQRQIDVLIDSRHDTDNRTRLIIDAKIKKRKIDVKEVESFLGLMDDVKATHVDWCDYQGILTV